MIRTIIVEDDFRVAEVHRGFLDRLEARVGEHAIQGFLAGVPRAADDRSGRHRHSMPIHRLLCNLDLAPTMP